MNGTPYARGSWVSTVDKQCPAKLWDMFSFSKGGEKKGRLASRPYPAFRGTFGRFDVAVSHIGVFGEGFGAMAVT